MSNNTLLPFDLPSVGRKKLTIDFAGGNQSSDGGLLLLRAAERKLGVCRRLAEAMPDRRDPERVRHAMFEMVMARASAIACGYEDAIDLDRLRHDPLMKVAVGRCPESGAPLASQSTISRLENAPSKTEAARLSAALLDQLGTTVRPGKLEVLDIDDTFCAAHGGQQLAFWNAHHDERGFASMHIYHVASGTPVAAILRPARTPKGSEVRTVIRHVTKRLRRHWPKTRIVWRGDSHYGRVEAMEWAEDHDADYIFGLAGNAALDALVAETAVNLRFHHAMSSKAKLRTYASFLYQAQCELYRRTHLLHRRLGQPGALWVGNQQRQPRSGHYDFFARTRGVLHRSGGQRDSGRRRNLFARRLVRDRRRLLVSVGPVWCCRAIVLVRK